MSKINTEFDTLFSSECLWLDQIIPANGYSWWLACFFTSPFQCPRMAHTGFSGSCAKIDLWWIREATGVTRFGCSWISCITAHFGDEVPDSGRWDSTWCFPPLYELKPSGSTGEPSIQVLLLHLSWRINLSILDVFFNKHSISKHNARRKLTCSCIRCPSVLPMQQTKINGY